MEEKGREENPAESAAFLSKETIDAALGESRPGEETRLAPLVNSTLVNDAQKVAKLAAEKKGVANGVASSC